MTIQEAIDWLQLTDITTATIWSAADRAGVSARQMAEELQAQNVIGDDAVQFVKKMSGRDYETVFHGKTRS